MFDDVYVLQFHKPDSFHGKESLLNFIGGDAEPFSTDLNHTKIPEKG